MTFFVLCTIVQGSMENVVLAACDALEQLLPGVVHPEIAAFRQHSESINAIITSPPPDKALETLDGSLLPWPFSTYIAQLSPLGDGPLARGWCVLFHMYTSLGLELTDAMRTAHAFVTGRVEPSSLTPVGGVADLTKLMDSVLTNPESTPQILTSLMSIARQSIPSLGTSQEQQQQLVNCLDTIQATFTSLMASAPP